MIYKILLIKNNIDKKLKLKKYLDWFKKYTPLEIIIDEIITNWSVVKSDELAGNDTYKNLCYIGGNIRDKIKDIVPPNKYNCVVLASGDKLGCLRASGIAFHEPLYKNTQFIQLFKYNDKGRTLNHELLHVMIYQANSQGASIEDPMDTYAFEQDLSVDNKINTNREMALDRLRPHWDKVCSLSNVRCVTITREPSDNKQTLGYLEAKNRDSRFYCRTLELPWRDNQKNISCIPPGVYKVVYTFSPKFIKYTYEIKSVPNRSGIRIHSGNFFFDIAGCILLGNGIKDINNDGEKDVINSKITVNAFEKFMNYTDFDLHILA